MLTILAGPLASYFGAQLIPSGRERKYLMSVLAGAAVNIVLNFFFIPKYGAVAAAITTAISQGVVAAINCYFVRDLPRPNLAKAVGFSVPATGLMAVTILGVRAAFPIHVVALVALGALLYACAYYLSRTVWNRIQTQSS
jgi:O-antigen/teichoic acid export membrane protein